MKLSGLPFSFGWPPPPILLVMLALLMFCLAPSPCLSEKIAVPDDSGSELPSTPPAGQDGLSREKPSLRPWQFIIGVGRRNDNDRWDDLVQGLASGGYDDGQCAGWFGPCPYPSGANLHMIVHLAVVRDIGEYFGVRLFWNSGDYVEATGYDDEMYSYLTINSSLKSWGLLIEYVPARVIRLGVGPTWNTLETNVISRDSGQNETGNSYSSLGVAGIALGAALSVPADSPVFLHLSLRMHVIPDQDIGPFQTMPATRMEMNHSAIVLGIGVSY